jgi:hypothetical protein
MAKPYTSGRHLDPAVRLGIDPNGAIKQAHVRGVDVSNDVGGYQVTRDIDGAETITLTFYGFAFDQIPDEVPPGLADQIASGIAQAEAGTTTDLGSFAEHLPEAGE